ncbi:PAS domain S-box protein [uncultured Rhodospira sp.]|uniref:PAS domain S-box protein n=1 Tax=uncultured Rhodospira sp. TaxID=1936189 RepID=UPI002601EA31|nr:PAS domain S-box protein [uncultured Rhodospira sp.]
MDIPTLSIGIDELRRLVEAVPVACYVNAMPEGRFVTMNAHMRALMRIDPDANVESMTTISLYADPSRRPGFIKQIRQQGLVRDVDFDGVRSDGTPLPCLASFQAMMWQGREVVLGCMIDITDRKATETALRASEEKFREIAENTSDVIWHLDPDLLITYYGGGSRLIDWLGYDEVIGRSALTFFDPESTERLRAGWMQRTAHEESGVPTERAHYDVRMMNAKGERLWVELMVYPHRNADGTLDGYFGVMRDISARKQAETALRQSETLFRQMFDADPVAKVLVDPETGLITNANSSAARLHGQDLAAFQGWSLAHLIEDPDGGDHDPLALLRDAATTGTPLEFTYRLKDDSHRRVAAHVGTVDVPVPDGAARRHLNVSLFDVTDRQRYALALEHRNADLKDFTAGVSHDLQEPLRLITSYLGLLERRLGDRLAPDEKEFIGFAVDGAVRMRTMIHSLLDYARLDSHALMADPVPLDDVLATVTATLRANLTEAGATVEALRPLPTVMADRRQMTSLFQNLIANAVRYRRPDVPSRITVTWDRQGDRAVLGVQDTGIGIDPKHHDRIFGVFQRLRRTGNDEDSGTGMGLAICRRIVERHEGRIWVESPPEGGTTFRFTLPLAESGTATDP